MFSSNTDSLSYQSFKEASWALISGLHLGDTIKGLLLVLGPFLISMFGLASWACAPIISNPVKSKSKDLARNLPKSNWLTRFFTVYTYSLQQFNNCSIYVSIFIKDFMVAILYKTNLINYPLLLT